MDGEVMIKPFEDIEGRAIDLLATQFQGAENLKKLVRIVTRPLQELEQVLTDLRDKRHLDDAFGAQLDGLGELVVEPRNGRDDETYREALRIRIFINVSDGEPETIITVLRILTAARRIRYWENHPAALQLETDGLNLPLDLADVIQGVSPAGVGNVPITITLGDSHPFRLSRLPEPVPLILDDGAPLLLDNGAPLLVTGDPGQNALEGGRLAEVIGVPLLLDDGAPLFLDHGAPLLLAGTELAHVVPDADQTFRMVEVLHLDNANG